ncbi:MAG: septal ring lytic transglycosylase RlpA family protein [Acidobacteria bacterium]|nr:septal ring lytic transglycosylase RlpA family protein [Acidobacteriota bacterium]
MNILETFTAYKYLDEVLSRLPSQGSTLEDFILVDFWKAIKAEAPRAHRRAALVRLFGPVVFILILAGYLLGLGIGEVQGRKAVQVAEDGAGRARHRATVSRAGLREARIEIDLLKAEYATLQDRAIAIIDELTTEGRASFYAYPFHGRPTASGEIFDKDKISAASRWLPFGSSWRVTRLDTGASIVVPITDRGPYAERIFGPIRVHVGNERILDLSEAAARAIGMIDAGVVRVRISPAIFGGSPADRREVSQ